MKTLREVLVALRKGDSIPLSSRRNQWNERICDKKLYFHRGQWVLWEVTCWSSSDFGFGTCQCHSHSPSDERVISRARALELIKDYINSSSQDEVSRIRETEWLEELIKKLPE